MRVKVIGGGLAGSEAARYLLEEGYEVDLYEGRPLLDTGAHKSADFGELVCSNSLKSKQLTNACGLLKEEMKGMNSLMIEAALSAEVPSGNALGVDRSLFSSYITEKLMSYPNLSIHREEVKSLPEGPTILATGPLTSQPLLDQLKTLLGGENLSFFDASAPIVAKSSIDFSKAYYKSRYEQSDSAYINCPFDKAEYYAFYNALISAEKAELHSFDTQYFEGCLPVEVIASRGPETLRHGPLKPFGLERPDGVRPYAVLQLRQDNKLGDYYNLVGFQTNLTFPEQRRVFRMIPGLEKAEFLSYGLMHKNAYLDSPRVLNQDLSLKDAPNVFVAGQLSGVEGYVESAAMGIAAAIELDRRCKGLPPLVFSKETVLGALIDYILHASGKHFQPMNANWALLSSSEKKQREQTIARSLSLIESIWLKRHE
ncbi:MAG: methylenetetrahydrofolate--tRNA-(uracil(54)-C(5))-methyltransferase (FADH(2)-oxidizing) TrmFO [Bacilli bacterium]|nr:methylenetetrahydrofolate--tRNA-(uracil(54)-C(5))-methyltransferase (FADH(2)-oxidizing) TrmFO [Bacilli bacterium]